MRRVLVLAITVASLAQLTPAHAGPPKGAARLMPHHGRLSEVRKPTPGACNTVEHTETVYNRWDVPMVSLSQEVYYCWGRVKKKHVLTAARFTTRVWTRPITPWRYDGPDSISRWGGRGQFEAGRTIQGKFHFCVLWYCPEAHPWVTQRVFGIGLYYGDGEP